MPLRGPHGLWYTKVAIKFLGGCMENPIIKNADIVLTGVALSDIYINKDHLLISGADIGTSNHDIQRLLNQETNQIANLPKDIWKTSIDNVEIFTELSKSHSAYRPLSKREYLAICQLGDMPYDSLYEHRDRDRLSTLAMTYAKALKILAPEELVLSNIELRFYEFGNVTITGVFKIRNKNLTMDQYHTLSDFAHAFFGAALRPSVSILVATYAKVMRRIDADTKIPLEMLKIPLDIDMDFSQDCAQNTSLKYNLDFAIRYHMIYDSSLKARPDFVAPFREVLTGEWELQYQEQIRLKHASIYFGWTHSLVLMEDYNPSLSIRDYETYRFPLEVVLTNWGALHSLSKRLERGRALFLKEMDEVEKHTFRKKKYSDIVDRINEFSIKVRRVLQSLDSYTVTNNPMHYRLIDLQQEVFLEHKSVERINSQLALVANLVDELSIREKNRAEARLNKVLTMLTMLTVIDIANTIYEAIFTGLDHLFTVGSIGGFMLLVLLIIYKYEPGRKKRTYEKTTP